MYIYTYNIEYIHKYLNELLLNGKRLRNIQREGSTTIRKWHRQGRSTVEDHCDWLREVKEE